MKSLDVTLNCDGMDSDVKIITGYIVELSHIMNECAADITASKLRFTKTARIRKNQQKLTELLERSIKTRYQSQAGILYGSTVDRLILAFQFTLKAAAQAKTIDFQQSFAEVNRMFALLQSLVNIQEPVSLTPNLQ